MLVLRRRVGETVLVGGEVEIEIIEISRTRVKLGVRAPLHVPVIRKETLPIVRENQLASDLVASGGAERVGELLKLFKPADTPPQSGLCGNAAGSEAPPAPAANGSTKRSDSRYETPERYSGYRKNRENPHPA
jgi:carbon storage regulator